MKQRPFWRRARNRNIHHEVRWNQTRWKCKIHAIMWKRRKRRWGLPGHNVQIKKGWARESEEPTVAPFGRLVYHIAFSVAFSGHGMANHHFCMDYGITWGGWQGKRQWMWLSSIRLFNSTKFTSGLLSQRGRLATCLLWSRSWTMAIRVHNIAKPKRAL